jgi:thymidine kinase
MTGPVLARLVRVSALQAMPAGLMRQQISKKRCLPTKTPLACVLVDEAQFLSKEQVWQAASLADKAGIPVVCYGLRTDFQGELFPGSAALLGIADSLVELKGVCDCGRKATMNLRVDEFGKAVVDGAQTEIGGDDRYIAMCRKHFNEARAGR